jgi:NADPH-dependent glutamate synthase beta subunit-like oxidoreductase
LGVQFVNGRRIGDLSQLAEYDALFVATGAGEGSSLAVPGSDSTGIRTAVDFLHDVNAGVVEAVRDEVVVIGGGSVALDAARTAVRIGAPLGHIVCLECSDFEDDEPMPGQEREVKEAREEGIVIHDKHGVQSFDVVDGAVSGVNCVQCLSVMDCDGHFAPCYVDGHATLKLSTGLVLVAAGQRPSEVALPIGLPRDVERNVAMRTSCQTREPRIFAGGDLLSGTTDVITAVAIGNETAESIHRYCQGLPVDESRRVIPGSSRPHVEKKSTPSRCRPASDRREDFDEVSLGFNDAECAEQSARCLHCGEMNPSAVIRRLQPKKNILPWDKEEAMRLWAKRHSENGEELPDVFDSVKDVLDPEDLPMYGRGKLMLKAFTSEEKLFFTTDDE